MIEAVSVCTRPDTTRPLGYPRSGGRGRGVGRRSAAVSCPYGVVVIAHQETLGRVVVAASSLGALAGTVVGVSLLLLTVGAVYLYGWRKPPTVSLGADASAEAGSETWVPGRHGSPMRESAVSDTELESADADAFDPVGTLAVLAIYFVVIGLAWLFMYFVEFLGTGPRVVG